LRSLKVAKSYLRQAKARLEDAVDALQEKNHPYAVRLSQECAELSLKAVLRAVGIEYPRVHEVSDVFPEIQDRFPDWFKVEIDFLRESSRTLFKKREPSLYGDEAGTLSPDEVMSSDDAEDGIDRAKRTYELCRKLVSQLESKIGSG